jgi:hypothetical protein
MRASRKLIAAAVLAGGLALGVGVTPAQAATLRGVYGTQADCFTAGWYGYNNYGWSWPECLQQDPNGNPQTLWFLYA